MSKIFHCSLLHALRMASAVYLCNLEFLHLCIESHRFESIHNPPTYFVSINRPSQKYTNFAILSKKPINNFLHCPKVLLLGMLPIIAEALFSKIYLCLILISQTYCNTIASFMLQLKLISI